MVGAESPERVTHGFCLSDSRWLHGMLEAREHPKIIENRQCRLSPGWYAVSLSHSASTGVYEEMSFRKRYPNYPGPMAYRTGQVRGLVKVGYSLPQGACKGHRWAAPDYDVANVITEVLPFDPERPGPSVRGYFGAFPLKGAERPTRAAANFAIGAGHRRKRASPSSPASGRPKRSTLPALLRPKAPKRTKRPKKPKRFKVVAAWRPKTASKCPRSRRPAHRPARWPSARWRR